MDQRSDGSAQHFDFLNEVTSQVELLDVGWQVLNFADLIVAEIENLQVLKVG